MKHFQNTIPVHNNLDKAIAFAPSIDKDYFRKTKKPIPTGYIDRVETIKTLQSEGWNIESVAEVKNSDRKVISNQIKFYHPDISMKKPNGSVEIKSNLYVTSDMDKSGLEMFLGWYRLVCSNGLITQNGDNFHYKHEQDLDFILSKIENEANQMLSKFNVIKTHQLTDVAQRELAKKALSCRFQGGALLNIDSLQLLKVNRDEDKGNDVWRIYNRIQENIIKPGMLVNSQGQNINGVFNIDENIRVNQNLYNTIIQPYMN